MTLKELEGWFFKYGNQDGKSVLHGVDSLVDAQGIMILCPKCFNGSSVSVHSVEITFADRGVNDNDGTHNKKGKPTRWKVIGGNGLDDLQLNPSILIEDGCEWHGFIGSNGVPPGHAK